MTTSWLISFLAGFLTVLAPCTLFLLPTILVGSTAGTANRWRPLLVTLSLGGSVFLFSLLIKGTSLAFVLPDAFWSLFSGLLLFLFGLTLVFPHLWEVIAVKLSLSKTQVWLDKSNRQDGPFGPVLLGASLGPVFSTCSPTFAVLLAVILPVNFVQGAVNILLFVIGMMIPFLLIGFGGQAVVARVRFMANPEGWFRKMLGVILVLVGIMVVFGWQKDLESWILDTGYLGPIQLEERLMKEM